MAVQKKIEILFDIPLPIVLDDSLSAFKYSSFSRRYHVYKDRWQPTVGDDSLLKLFKVTHLFNYCFLIYKKTTVSAKKR